MVYRKFRKKKRYRRRKRFYKKKSGPSNVRGPLSNKQLCKFIYSDRISLDPGVAGAPAAHVLSANGIYDPDITGVGHQPRAFDQLMQMYDHAVVIGSKITIWVNNTDAALGNMLVIQLRDGTVVSTTPTDILEYRYSKVKMFSGDQAGLSTGVLSMKCNPNGFLGRTKPLSDPELKNSVASNPVEQAFWHLYAFNNSDQDTGRLDLRYKIEYTTILIEPKQLPIS